MKVLPNMEYLQHYKELLDNSLDNKDPYKKFKNESFEIFSKIGFPIAKKGNERWKYLDLRALSSQKYFQFSRNNSDSSTNDALLANFKDSINLIIDNGFNATPEIPEGLEIISTENVNVGSLANNNEDGFISLNSALFKEVIAIRVTQKYKHRNLNIFFNAQLEEEVLECPRIYMEIEDGVDIVLNELHSPGGSDILKIPVIEIIVKENARVSHNRILVGSPNEKNFTFTRVSQANNSFFKSTTFSSSPFLASNDIKISLDGEGSECDLSGLYFTAGTSQFNTHVVVDHNVPNTKSNQFYKGILSDQSKAVFSGKIYVARGAQKSYATQKDLNLLMSKGAEIDTKPSLEIYADDVECFHGATAGHVDDSTLFYMMTRGIPKDIATQMLIRGFADEIIDEITDATFRELAIKQTDLLLPELSFD